ncbi:MAG: hypothetical protein ABIH82_00855 [Candidatus Woesearchaeota archaeon]
MEELADVLEVIYALAGYYGITFKQLNEIRKQKKNKNGGFHKGLILEKVEE